VANTMNCPVCGKLTDSRLDACPHCGAYLKSRKERAAKQAGTTKNCPRCNAIVQENDIICTACGTNLLTGQQVSEETAARKRRGMPTGLLVGVAIATVLIVVVAAVWIYASTRDPLRQAQRLAEEGRTLEAQSLLEGYVERARDDATALMLLGQLQWANREYAEAARSYARVSELRPGNADAPRWVAIALARVASPGSSQLLQALERAAQANPDDTGLLYALALAQGANENPEAMKAGLEDVLDARMTDDSARWSLGMAHALAGELDQAKREFMTVGPGPRRNDAVAALGFVAAMEGDTQQAKRRFDEAMAAGEFTAGANAYIVVGKLLLGEGASREAQIQFERATEIDPNDRAARYYRGLALQARNRLDEALRDYDQLTAVAGDFEAEANVRSAEIHLAQGAPDRARRALDKASRAGADSAAYHTAMGRVAVTERDIGRALQAFQTAIRIDPRFAGAYLERGLLEIQREELAEGIRDLETYLELVGDQREGTRYGEVAALVEQLREASEEGSRAPRRGAGARA